MATKTKQSQQTAVTSTIINIHDPIKRNEILPSHAESFEYQALDDISINIMSFKIAVVFVVLCIFGVLCSTKRKQNVKITQVNVYYNFVSKAFEDTVIT